jgi:hypothetical protein
MATFMAAISSKVRPHLGSSWSQKDLDAAWRYCALASPLEFDTIFPQLPDFMRGADKAMLVGWILSELLGADDVRGSDASISEGLAVLYGTTKERGLGVTDMTLS